MSFVAVVGAVCVVCQIHLVGGCEVGRVGPTAGPAERAHVPTVERICHPIGGVEALVVGYGVVALGVCVVGRDVQIGVGAIKFCGQLGPRLCHHGVDTHTECCETLHLLGHEGCGAHHCIGGVVVCCTLCEPCECGGEIPTCVGSAHHLRVECCCGSSVAETHLGGCRGGVGISARQACACRANIPVTTVIKSYTIVCWLFTTGAPAGLISFVIKSQAGNTNLVSTFHI